MRHSTASCAIILTSGSCPFAVASMSSTISSSDSFSLKILTALSGSPTYLPPPNATVLTSPPSLTSRHGVMRGLNISELREVPEEPRPVVVTLLGMELHAVDVPGVHGAAEVDAIRRLGGHVLTGIAGHV